MEGVQESNVVLGQYLASPWRDCNSTWVLSGLNSGMVFAARPADVRSSIALLWEVKTSSLWELYSRIQNAESEPKEKALGRTTPGKPLPQGETGITREGQSLWQNRQGEQGRAPGVSATHTVPIIPIVNKLCLSLLAPFVSRLLRCWKLWLNGLPKENTVTFA